MRKFIAVMIALLMVATMLSSGALAENGKEHKGGKGAGKGHNQSHASVGKDDKGDSNRQGDTLNKFKADDEELAVFDNGNEDEDADDADNGKAHEPSGHGKKNSKENKPDEKTKEGPRHGNGYGRVRNTQEVLDSIGLLAGEETAVQLNTLMMAYREAKDRESAKAALTALLDALTLSCTAAATNENGEVADGQEQLTLMNMEKLREKVLANAGNDNGTLLALMHAYEKALRIMNHLEPIDDLEDGIETDDQSPNTGTVAVPGI